MGQVATLPAVSVDALIEERTRLEKLFAELPGQIAAIQREISMLSLSSSVLTERQREVLGGILQRKGNKEIGRELNISERTVKFHVSRMLKKIHSANRQEIFICYRERT